MHAKVKEIRFFVFKVFQNIRRTKFYEKVKLFFGVIFAKRVISP